MNRSNLPTLAVTVALLTWFNFPICGQEPSHEVGDNSNRSPLLIQSVSLELGYFAPRRERFRDKFGTFLSGGLVVPLKNVLHGDISARLSFTHLKFSEYPAVYWDLSLVSLYSRVLNEGENMQWVGGLGGGLSVRRIGATLNRVDETGYFLGTFSVHKIQWDSVLTAFYGPTFRRGANSTWYLRLYFTYHLDGGGDLGNFGDTGGFSLVVGKAL